MNPGSSQAVEVVGIAGVDAVVVAGEVVAGEAVAVAAEL